jgi:hypothetical protein
VGREEEQVAKATGRLILSSVELSYYFDFSRWIVELHLPAIQFRLGTRNHLHEALLNDASLRLTRGYTWTWRIALNDVSVKSRPLRLFQPWRREETFG